MGFNDNTNVRTELVEMIRACGLTKDDVLYGKIVLAKTSENLTWKFHTGSQFHSVLVEVANQEYDAGYGGQELFGTVVFKDDSWFERWEYDGSEGWSHKKCPTMEESYGE